MKLILPSNGLLGQKTVELKQPCFKDLRDLERESISERSFKNNVVLKLCEDIDPEKITRFDRDYIYTIITAALNFNQIDYTVACNCGKKHNLKMNLSEKDVIEFIPKERSLHKEIQDYHYDFYVLSMKDDMEISDYLDYVGDSEDLFTDLLVLKTLGLPITEEGLETIQSLDIAVYCAVLLFISCTFHGVELVDEITCSCERKFPVYLELNSDCMRITPQDIMNRFVQINKYIDYNSFLGMTIPEYTSLVNSLNEKLSK